MGRFRMTVADKVSAFCAYHRIAPDMERLLHELVYQCCGLTADLITSHNIQDRK